MAVVETIRIEGDTSGIENKIQKLNKSIEGLVDTVEDVGTESKKSFDKMEKESGETTKAVKETDNTLKGFIKSIKLTAAVTAGLAIVKGIFQNMQPAIDAVNIAMTTLTLNATNLVRLLSGEIGLKAFLIQAQNSIDIGKRIIELNKESLIAEVRRQEIQLDSQKLAEQERQVRDDVTKTIEERIAANEKISEITKDQLKQEREQIQIQINAAQNQAQVTGKIEDEVVLRQKRLQLKELDERLTSVESERLANQNSLLAEQNALFAQRNENDAESIRLRGEGLDRFVADSEVYLDEVEVLERTTLTKRLEREFDYYKKSVTGRLRFNNERLLELKSLGQTETDEYEQLLRQRLDIEQEYGERSLQFQNDIFNSRIQTVSGGFDLAGQSAQAFADLNDALSANDQANAEEAFKRTKALQLAGAIANTASAVTAQLAVPQDALTGANFVKAGIALTTGLAQIATIKSTKFEQQPTTSPTTIVSAPTQPAQFNIVGESGTNQLLEGIAGTFDRPVRAYVVSGEVLSGSQLDRQRIRTATFP